MLPMVNLPIFLAAALVLAVTPGPAVLYIVTRSVDQGRRAGLVSVLGIEIGNLFHVFAAALGISAILMTSALAFEIVKYLGAAYLIYIGIRKLLTRSAGMTWRSSPIRSFAGRSRRACSSPCSTPRRRCSFWHSCRSSSILRAVRFRSSPSCWG
ncbi:MAG: LysE family translocator [Anaerolineae bacterium]